MQMSTGYFNRKLCNSGQHPLSSPLAIQYFPFSVAPVDIGKLSCIKRLAFQHFCAHGSCHEFFTAVACLMHDLTFYPLSEITFLCSCDVYEAGGENGSDWGFEVMKRFLYNLRKQVWLTNLLCCCITPNCLICLL